MELSLTAMVGADGRAVAAMSVLNAAAGGMSGAAGSFPWPPHAPARAARLKSVCLDLNDALMPPPCRRHPDENAGGVMWNASDDTFALRQHAVRYRRALEASVGSPRHATRNVPRSGSYADDRTLTRFMLLQPSHSQQTYR